MSSFSRSRRAKWKKAKRFGQKSVSGPKIQNGFLLFFRGDKFTSFLSISRLHKIDGPPWKRRDINWTPKKGTPPRYTLLLRITILIPLDPSTRLVGLFDFQRRCQRGEGGQGVAVFLENRIVIGRRGERKEGLIFQLQWNSHPISRATVFDNPLLLPRKFGWRRKMARRDSALFEQVIFFNFFIIFYNIYF